MGYEKNRQQIIWEMGSLNDNKGLLIRISQKKKKTFYKKKFL